MNIAIITSLIAGGVSISTALGAILSSIHNAERTTKNAQEIERLKIENEKKRHVSKFSEPFARAAYDLQSRLFNILRMQFIEEFFVNGSVRERSYAVNNTAFLVAQYACWAELVRREIQFIDLGEDNKTRQLLYRQDDIFGIWGTDSLSGGFRIFAGELRAIGEVLIQTHEKEAVCMGYGAFLSEFPPGKNVLIDAVKNDIECLQEGLEGATVRVRRLQHALIDLLELLDPYYIRFPKSRRSKA